MAWFVIPGVIAAVGAAKVINNNRTITCGCCKKKNSNKNFDYYKFDGVEESVFASRWLHVYEPLCKECGLLVDEVYRIVLKKINDVETYPIQYKGKKFEKRIRNKIPINLDSDGHHGSESAALKELKINAVFHQCNTVINVIYDYNADEIGGGHYRFEYIAKGTAYVPEGTKAEWKGFSGPEQLKKFIQQNSDL